MYPMIVFPLVLLSLAPSQIYAKAGLQNCNEEPILLLTKFDENEFKKKKMHLFSHLIFHLIIEG
jgi:hypothetical protein